MAAVFAVMVCAACPARTPPDGAETPSPHPVRGGTLQVLFAEEPDAFDPNRAASPGSWFVARAVHRGLLAFPDRPFPAGATPVPDLIEGMPAVSGLHYRFTLRAGVRFAPPSSRPIQAADVVSSIARVRATGVGIAAALSDVASARAIDARTIEITLKRARTDFLWILAHPQAAIVPAGSPARTSGVGIAGAGPYRITSYVPEASLVLERNPNWSDDDVRSANVDEVHATFGVGIESGVAMVARGDADLIADPGPPDVISPKLPSDARTIVSSTGCVRYLFLDPRTEPLENTYARRAIAEGIERDTLPSAASAVRATGLLPPFVTGSSDSSALAESIVQARADLGRARYARGFRVRMIIEDAPRDRGDAVAIGRSLARIGITVDIVRLPPPDLVLHYQDRRNVVPMGLATWCADWPGNAGWNVVANVTARAQIKGLEAMLNSALSATDVASFWQRLDRVICTTATVIPLEWTTRTTVLGPRVRGVQGGPAWSGGDPTNVWLAR